MAHEHDWFRARPPGISESDYVRAKRAAIKIAFQRFGSPWVPVILIIAFAVLILSNRFTRPLAFWVRVAGLIGPAVLMLWWTWLRLGRRMFRQLRLHGAAICDHCGYAMPEARGDEQCPECGTRVVDMNPIGALQSHGQWPLLSVETLDQIFRHFSIPDRPLAKELCIAWRARCNNSEAGRRSEAELLRAIRASGGSVERLIELLGLEPTLARELVATDFPPRPS